MDIIHIKNILRDINKKRSNKYYKNEQDYSILFYIIRILKVESFNDIIENTTLLNSIIHNRKGHIMLYYINRINTINISENKIYYILYQAARFGTYETFILLLNKVNKDNDKDIIVNILENSARNNDPRIFKKYVRNIDKNNLYGILKNIITCKIPVKYKIKRIKLIFNTMKDTSINTEFHYLVFSMVDPKLILTLHKFYYNTSHTFLSIRTIIDRLKNNNSNMIKFYNILKTSEEKHLFNIYLLLLTGNTFYVNKNMEDIIVKNYIDILQIVDYKLSNKIIIGVLQKHNLINKFYHDSLYNNIQFLTKFYDNNNMIKVNRALSLLRIKMKTIYNKKIFEHKIKYIYIHDEILNRSKKDENIIMDRYDFLCYSLPPNIYPYIYLNDMVKLSYIEDKDIYLLIDIDISHTSAIERYNYIRNMHPYTRNTKINIVKNMEEYNIYKKLDIENMDKFIQDNQDIVVKWYPIFNAVLDI
jgi:hypothetical protein